MISHCVSPASGTTSSHRRSTDPGSQAPCTHPQTEVWPSFSASLLQTREHSAEHDWLFSFRMVSGDLRQGDQNASSDGAADPCQPNTPVRCCDKGAQEEVWQLTKHEGHHIFSISRKLIECEVPPKIRCQPASGSQIQCSLSMATAQPSAVAATVKYED